MREAGLSSCLPLDDGADVTVDRGSGSIVVAANHRVRITTIHDARPTLICSSHAELRLITRDRSMPEVLLENRASLRAQTLGASSPVIRGRGSSWSTVVARDNSKPLLEILDASQFRLMVQDAADPQSHDWPPGWRARPSEIYVGQRLTGLTTAIDAERVARRFVAEWRNCGNRLSAAMRVGDAIPMLCDDIADVRWRGGTIHVELFGDDGPWLSHDAHDPHPFTEASRAACTRLIL